MSNAIASLAGCYIIAQSSSTSPHILNYQTLTVAPFVIKHYLSRVAEHLSLSSNVAASLARYDILLCIWKSRKSARGPYGCYLHPFVFFFFFKDPNTNLDFKILMDQNPNTLISRPASEFCHL